MIPVIRRRQQSVGPFDALWDIRRDMDRIFDTLSVPSDAVSALPAEVLETDQEVRFMIEIPGMKPEDIELTVENNVLAVSGEKRWQKEEGRSEGDYHLLERRYGKFSRSFTLPQRVDSSRGEASYEHGVLTIQLPKTEEAKPRRIEVRASGEGRQLASK
jgi:HSP20 family protein